MEEFNMKSYRFITRFKSTIVRKLWRRKLQTLHSDEILPVRDLCGDVPIIVLYLYNIHIVAVEISKPTPSWKRSTATGQGLEGKTSAMPEEVEFNAGTPLYGRAINSVFPDVQCTCTLFVSLSVTGV
ncbi:hypothetical protein MKW98_013566 [Papaver atlanticum]|uniref:Uncharacterized protein n=1 Tax=Papaver atlanticum TaxID=357466 RepID=A0AAD4T309_9MAGN|nr:hypothetical protein MKW98_013566 [Papaver atlanticum]